MRACVRACECQRECVCVTLTLCPPREPPALGVLALLAPGSSCCGDAIARMAASASCVPVEYIGHSGAEQDASKHVADMLNILWPCRVLIDAINAATRDVARQL
jgi:hypothetical protein